jgi:spore maturation protein CgeB
MTLRIVILGLSITSSWGNGHATTYRALVKALQARGHAVTFLERDVPWYAEHRDLAAPPYCSVALYKTLPQLAQRHAELIARADLVIVGSYVPDGAAIGDWVTRVARGVTAFYDIDTPITMAALDAGTAEYIVPALIPRFDLYLSFTGGPVLERIEREYGSPRARALFCAVDPDLHRPVAAKLAYALGYLGTYSADRQPPLERLLVQAARSLPNERFAVAGPQYPHEIAWPKNVERIEHLPPAKHPAFYCSQRFTLNITRRDMVAAGHSPSVRLFEAAACGVPIVTDRWNGLDAFFRVGEEIFVAEQPGDVLAALALPEERRRAIAAAARKRVLHAHTAAHRAQALESYVAEVHAAAPRKPVVAVA